MPGLFYHPPYINDEMKDSRTRSSIKTLSQVMLKPRDTLLSAREKQMAVSLSWLLQNILIYRFQKFQYCTSRIQTGIQYVRHCKREHVS